MSDVRRPVLRYHGGKWLLAPWIIRHLPAHRTYVEPFGGGGSVLLRKPRSYSEIYNDLDGEVVNLFRVLRDPETAAELERAVRLTPFARSEFELSYEAVDDPVEQARRTLLRSHAGFGSVGASGRKTGFRNNVSRSGSTPAQDWANFAALIEQFTERLRGVVVENRDALHLTQRVDAPDVLFYCDPPYPHSTRTETAQWDHIYRHEMTDDDHRALAEVLHGLEGMVVLSGYPCDLYDDELFPDWHRTERVTLADGARRNTRRPARTEALWLNDAAAKRQQQTTLFDRGAA